MLIPCIDLQSGQAVQLVHGRKRELAVADVFGLLEKFKGHRWLHVIDLDAAMGKRSNDALLRELIRGASRNHGFRVRAGGGIRTVRRAAQLAELGADQVIIGSAAFRGGKPHARFLRALGAKLGRARVVVALTPLRAESPWMAGAVPSRCVQRTSCPLSSRCAADFSAPTWIAKEPCPAPISPISVL